MLIACRYATWYIIHSWCLVHTQLWPPQRVIVFHTHCKVQWKFGAGKECSLTYIVAILNVSQCMPRMLWPTAWSERVILYIGSICMHVCTEHAVFCFEPRTNVGKHSIKWTTTATDLSFIVWLPGFPHWWSYWMLTPSFTALWFCMCWRIYCMLHTVECNGWWISLLVVQYSDYNECRLTMQLLLWGSTTECTAG